MKGIYINSILFIAAIIGFSSCNPTVAKFMKETSSNEAPAKVTFKNSSENAETYAWDFGDGKVSEEKDPVHTYIKPGKYTITLTVRKGKKIVTASEVVEVGGTEHCLVELTTDFGVMVVELSDETPQHRDNFLKLVEDGFYNDLLFHRVINGFMIQGGDPTSKNAKPSSRLGSGGPGYQVPAEINPSRLAHVKGALAAARQPDGVNPEKKSSGSQFYIVHGGPVTESTLRRQEAKMDEYYSPEVKATYLNKGGFPLLDGGYTVFGKVISGMEVIDKIANVTTDGDPPKGTSRPKVDVKMTMKVIE